MREKWPWPGDREFTPRDYFITTGMFLLVMLGGGIRLGMALLSLWDWLAIS